MIFDNGARINIDYTCNGLTAILLYTVAILSYPTHIKNKITWFTGGYIIIVAINLLRIFFFSYAVTINPDYFYWSHDYVGRYGMGLLTLSFFFIFTLYARVSR
jgi:exosortase/archaeosortase family protein